MLLSSSCPISWHDGRRRSCLVVKTVCLSRQSSPPLPLWYACFKERQCSSADNSRKIRVVGSLCDREIVHLASDRVPENTNHLYSMCTMSAKRARRWSHNPHGVLLAQSGKYMSTENDLKWHQAHLFILDMRRMKLSSYLPIMHCDQYNVCKTKCIWSDNINIPYTRVYISGHRLM